MKSRLFSTTLIAGVCLAALPAAAQTSESGTDVELTSNASEICREGYIRADLDDDGTITEDEVAQLGEAEFAQFDQDGDGVVTRDEYMNCHANWLKNQQPVTADGQQQADAGDGTAAQQDKTAAEIAADMDQSAGIDEQVFPDVPIDRFDQDGDGTLTAEEFMAGAEETASDMRDDTNVENAQQTSAASDGQTGAMADDGSDDAVLVLRRLIFVPHGYDADRMRGMSRDETAARAGLRFILLDTDSDQQISQEEWENPGWAETVYAEDYLNRTFDDIDADQSGDVSQLEYLQYGNERWERAKLSAENKGTMETERGAPIVYFRYPGTM